MKNKIRKSINLAAILACISFLNVSNCIRSNSNMMETDTTGYNKQFGNIKNDESAIEIDVDIEENEIFECPCCQEGDLFLYKLSDAYESLALHCDECCLSWDNSNPSLDNLKTKEDFAKAHDAQDYADLFKQGERGWATREKCEKDDMWKDFLKHYDGIKKQAFIK